jgi:hypothetical protein
VHRTFDLLTCALAATFATFVVFRLVIDDDANGATYDNAVAPMFDKVMGIPANSGVSITARTAYLRVNYRLITPIETELDFAAALMSVDGRKRIVRSELEHGSILCAIAERLFLH